MQTNNAWTTYSQAQLNELTELNNRYMDFISQNKTERECCTTAVELAQKAGFVSLEELMAQNKTLVPGQKLYATNHNKTIMLVTLGTQSLEEGLNILGAHIDSPRLDIKQNPLAENHELVTLDTHYYGGIKYYQWLTIPLSLHGVFVKKDGKSVAISIGEDATDPVFCISDLLIHLSSEQLQKKAQEVVEAEMLDIIFGNSPLVLGKAKEQASSPDATQNEDIKDQVKAAILALLHEKYQINEEDFISAELEVVPAGPARDLGLDRSLILGYGHDDRSCAFTSLAAHLAAPVPARSSVTLLVDKEEIGSVGATGMTSRFFEDTLAEVLALAGLTNPLSLRRCLRNSQMLSSDVSAAFDPNFAGVFEEKNSAYLAHGLAFNKYTGVRGKSGSNDADAEYVARIRACMDKAGVNYQTCELGKVNAGGGGTIAYILAEYGMDVIDCGVPVLSMHAPWEIASKADIYEAYRGYRAFLELER